MTTTAPPVFDVDLAVGTPSPESLALLSRIDPDTLTPDDATALAIGCELGKRLLDGIQLRALAVAADRTRREKGDLSAPGQELAAATGLHRHDRVLPGRSGLLGAVPAADHPEAARGRGAAAAARRRHRTRHPAP